MFTLAFSSLDTERKIRSLAEKAKAAIPRALNRSIASGRTVMVRAIATDLGMTQNKIRDRIKIDSATAAFPVARLRASNKKLPLILFGAKGPRPSRGRGRGVTARLKGGAGRYEHAFIATVTGPQGGQHEGVFSRKAELVRKSKGAWGENLPIYELHGPSIVRVFEKYQPLGLARAKEALVTNLQHEIGFATSQSAEE